MSNTTTALQPWLDPTQKPYIQIQGVTKKFGDFVAIDHISLDVYQNEFFALLGPSGCGKTTLLRMLAGFETPTSGRILLDGEDVSTVPPHQRLVNMMFQSYALFPHMTVEKNIGFGLKQDKVPAAQIKKQVDDMLELVQLTAFAGRKPHQLSGGQRQRVALARSLVKRPKLLLLDEPLGALDKKLREQTQFELMNIQEELGITFMIVTHDQEEAMTVSSRIGLMINGQLEQVSTPSEIYEAPKTRFVSEFIGDVNLLEGRYAGTSEHGTAIKCKESDSEIHATQALDVLEGTTIWVAIRPEKLEISKQPPEGTPNVLKGKVWDIGYGGSFSTYHVHLANGKTMTAVRANRERSVEKTITWDDEVYLSWAPKSAVVLTE
ncbi:MAG: ABC transporter ATP-binding protein [Proteobacteria bacterium]|nr:ABC transporter ATP-binding protein [Pseudomonadota bacterium]